MSAHMPTLLVSSLAHAHTCAHMYTHVHTCTHMTHVHTYVCTTCTHMHAHTLTHMYIYTHTHTHAHVCHHMAQWVWCILNILLLCHVTESEYSTSVTIFGIASMICQVDCKIT